MALVVIAYIETEMALLQLFIIFQTFESCCCRWFSAGYRTRASWISDQGPIIIVNWVQQYLLRNILIKKRTYYILIKPHKRIYLCARNADVIIFFIWTHYNYTPFKSSCKLFQTFRLLQEKLQLVGRFLAYLCISATIPTK